MVTIDSIRKINASKCISITEFNIYILFIPEKNYRLPEFRYWLKYFFTSEEIITHILFINYIPIKNIVNEIFQFLLKNFVFKPVEAKKISALF